MFLRSLSAGIMLATSVAHAQPVSQPVGRSTPLAQIHDEEELDNAVAAIVEDSAIHSDDKVRSLVAALLTGGVRELRAEAYEQALASFLEAYNEFPSAKILPDIALTLRDMGHPAEAANTYQRYLIHDVASGIRNDDPAQIAEAKQNLMQLDAKLTLLTVRVQPRGSEISVDGGPFVGVGSALITRVRPGTHLVRVRTPTASKELSINGFDGERKEVTVVVAVDPPSLPTVATPEEVHGWLVVGTRWGTDDARSNQRVVLSGSPSAPVKAKRPDVQVDDEGDVLVEEPQAGDKVSMGVIGVMRVDGKGRGIAGGLGLALSPLDSVELELAGLKSDIWGAYAGIRVRFHTGWLRPYVGGGVPLFFFKDDGTMQNTVVLGLRAAGGVELKINKHLGVQVDLGIEHFFDISKVLVNNKRPDATVFVPTLGVIGRL